MSYLDELARKIQALELADSKYIYLLQATCEPQCWVVIDWNKNQSYMNRLAQQYESGKLRGCRIRVVKNDRTKLLRSLRKEYNGLAK